MADHIPQIRELIHSIPNSTEFVRSVLGNMTGYQGDTQVRFSSNRKLKYPDYLVEWRIYDEVTGTEVIHIQTEAFVSGRTHKPECVNEENLSLPWIDEEASFRDIQILLGELRGVTPKS